MAREKRAKPKIKRRSAGLVITPPAPRPVDVDHPARLLFKEAIASAKALPEQGLAAKELAAEGSAQLKLPADRGDINTATAGAAAHSAPLQIFKELKVATTTATKEELPAPVVAQRGEQNGAFEEHFGQWRPFLPEAQMCILEALFNMTHALGTDHCLTSMPKLAGAAGISERQTYNVVKELEKHGFIERPETFNTPTKKGTIFRLHLARQGSHAGANRRYHFGD